MSKIKKYITFGAPKIGKEEINEVVNSLKSGWIGTGPKVAKFEEIIRNYTESKYALSLNSCTAALHLSLLACGIGRGDEVITSPLTFAATANTIIHVGARPVFADIKRETINIKEDLIEERGRKYGFEKIREQKISSAEKPILINKNFYYKNKVKDFLVKNGFSEVHTYAFTDKGEAEMENPLASDKKFLRANLKDVIKKSLDFNLHYIDLLGLDQIKIFEIGKIFKDGKETDYLAVGIRNSPAFKGAKEDDEIKIISDNLAKDLGVVIELEFSEKGVVEIDFEKMIENLPAPESYQNIQTKNGLRSLKYEKISPYPFVLRDIAVFVPEGVNEKDVASIIEKEASTLLVNKKLFDVFVKKFPDGTSKTSFAFRLVFQSQEKTLSDEEVNKIMERISKSLNNKTGWQVR